jgi:peptidoglycan/xylan/chitin deacetylase (PgdA/CDA1 family)
VSRRVPRPLRRAVARLVAFAAPGAAASLRVLTYHRVNDSHPNDRLTVTTGAFAAQMEALAARWSVVPLESALDAIEGRAALPARAVAITFDDGYRDNFDCALPILDRHRLPATFFVATGFIGTASRMDRYHACCADDEMLSWEQVADMRRRGHAIGGHGRRHLELAALAEAEARVEIEGSREDLERHLGAPASLFCYPRGSESGPVRALVARAGYRAAVTVRPGGNAAGADLFGLCRTEVSGDDDLADFELKLDGGFDGWHRLVQLSRAWREPRA